MITCPRCHGKKEILGLSFSAKKSVVLVCDICNGHGEITEEKQQLINIGAQRKSDRIARGMTLRKEANRLGLKPSILSAIERGSVHE